MKRPPWPQYYVNQQGSGRTNVFRHTINTDVHTPIRQARRQIPMCQQVELDAMIRDVLERKII